MEVIVDREEYLKTLEEARRYLPVLEDMIDGWILWIKKDVASKTRRGPFKPGWPYDGKMATDLRFFQVFEKLSEISGNLKRETAEIVSQNAAVGAETWVFDDGKEVLYADKNGNWLPGAGSFYQGVPIPPPPVSQDELRGRE